MFFSVLFVLLLFFAVIFTYFQFLFYYILLGYFLVFIFSNYGWSFYCFNSVSGFSDYLSFLLMFLTYLIMYFVILLNFFKMDVFMLVNSYIMMVALCLCFFVNSLILFFIFFEISLLPLIFMILLKGGSLERFKASLYLFLFTLSGSLCLLLMILFMDTSLGFNLSKFCFFSKNSGLVWLLLILIFFIKSPLYGVHMWLPKAHVEAPVEGSMLLAGVLLKLGGFGLVRLLGFIYISKVVFSFLFFFSVVSLVGGFLVSIVCLRQVDLKMMVAYSSVSHMGLLLGGLLSLTKLGGSGAVLMMVAHGFCSSALFYSGSVFYSRYKTRNLMVFKGFVQIFAFLVGFWLIFSVFNMGTPPSMNFFCELLLIFSLLKKSIILMFILSLIMVFSVLYSLGLYMSLGHGMCWFLKPVKKEYFLEMIILVGHLIFLVLYLFSVKMFMFYV